MSSGEILLVGIIIGLLLSSGGNNNNSSSGGGIINCKRPTYPAPGRK